MPSFFVCSINLQKVNITRTTESRKNNPSFGILILHHRQAPSNHEKRKVQYGMRYPRGAAAGKRKK
jgi:hypothetical protein